MKILAKIILIFIIISSYNGLYAWMCVPPKDAPRGTIFHNIMNDKYYKSDNWFIDFFIDQPFFKTNLLRKMHYSIWYEYCLETEEWVNMNQLNKMDEIRFKNLNNHAKWVIVFNVLSMTSILALIIGIVLWLFSRKNNHKKTWNNLKKTWKWVIFSWIFSFIIYPISILIVTFNRMILQPEKSYWENGKLIEEYSSLYYTSFETYKFFLWLLIFFNGMVITIGILNKRMNLHSLLYIFLLSFLLNIIITWRAILF